MLIVPESCKQTKGICVYEIHFGIIYAFWIDCPIQLLFIVPAHLSVRSLYFVQYIVSHHTSPSPIRSPCSVYMLWIETGYRSIGGVFCHWGAGCFDRHSYCICIKGNWQPIEWDHRSVGCAPITGQLSAVPEPAIPFLLGASLIGLAESKGKLMK